MSGDRQTRIVFLWLAKRRIFKVSALNSDVFFFFFDLKLKYFNIDINEEKCLSEAVVWVNSLNAVDKVIWITAKEKSFLFFIGDICNLLFYFFFLNFVKKRGK